MKTFVSAIVAFMMLYGTSAKVVRILEIDEIAIDEDLQEKDLFASDDVISALAPLHFPSDCNAKELTGFARKCGLKVTAGGNHWLVKDHNQLLTTIPFTVYENNTCRAIIKTLNDRCT